MSLFNTPPGISARDINGPQHMEDCLCCGESFPVQDLDGETGLCERCEEERTLAMHARVLAAVLDGSIKP